MGRANVKWVTWQGRRILLNEEGIIVGGKVERKFRGKRLGDLMYGSTPTPGERKPRPQPQKSIVWKPAQTKTPNP